MSPGDWTAANRQGAHRHIERVQGRTAAKATELDVGDGPRSRIAQVLLDGREGSLLKPSVRPHTQPLMPIDALTNLGRTETQNRRLCQCLVSGCLLMFGAFSQVRSRPKHKETPTSLHDHVSHFNQI